jgi:hypothetical protein
MTVFVNIGYTHIEGRKEEKERGREKGKTMIGLKMIIINVLKNSLLCFSSHKLIFAIPLIKYKKLREM